MSLKTENPQYTEQQVSSVAESSKNAGVLGGKAAGSSCSFCLCEKTIAKKVPSDARSGAMAL